MTSQAPSMAGHPRKKVLVVDDHPFVRMGLASVINEESDLVVCAEVDGDIAAMTAIRTEPPDIAVVDWSLRGGDAAALIKILRWQHPPIPVLVLSIHEEFFYAERALRAGAQGYVMKKNATEKIIEAIRCVAAGHSYFNLKASVERV
jgi:DNA-binding NarL/FixJ family response regulator